MIHSVERKITSSKFNEKNNNTKIGLLIVIFPLQRKCSPWNEKQKSFILNKVACKKAKIELREMKMV